MIHFRLKSYVHIRQVAVQCPPQFIIHENLLHFVCDSIYIPTYHHPISVVYSFSNLQILTGQNQFVLVAQPIIGARG